MKTRVPFLLSLTLLTAPSHLHAQGTAFTYQGRLNNSGSPASGLYDFRFKLFADPSGSTQVGTSYLTNGIPAVNGLFSTTINFGAGLFNGSNYWLGVDVRTNGAGGYTVLNPLQAVTPTPYAVFANTTSNLSGTVSASQLSGTLASANLSGTYGNAVTLNNPGNSFSGDGSGLTGLNASQLTSGTVPDGRLAASVARTSQVWLLNGNAGISPGINFVGTTDNQPLILKVNGQQATRLEPTSDTPNVVGGYSGNYVKPGLPGVTIGGGGTAIGNQPNIVTNNGYYATIAGGYGNTVTNYGGAILGGSVNFAGGYFAAIGAGQFHTNLGSYSFIGGGFSNQILSLASNSFIGGGRYNSIQTNSYFATVGGGEFNSIQTNSYYCTVGGGEYNIIQANSSFSTIGGGINNTNSGNFTTVGGGWGNIAAGGGTIAGGFYNAAALGATVGGGSVNTASGESATVSGGGGNAASSYWSWVGGGANNTASGDYASVGGGQGNIASGPVSTISGGYSNVASGEGCFAAGIQAHANHLGTFVWADDSGFNFSSTTANQFRVRATGGVAFVTAIDASGGVTAGVHLLSGDTAWSSISDKHAKKNFQPVDGEAVLEKLAAIPVQQWNYKWEPDTTTPHIGPMAQDFKGAFYPGRDDKSISTLEFDGVELAAIQGLNHKLTEELKRRDAENAELKQRLEVLEKMVRNLKPQ